MKGATELHVLDQVGSLSLIGRDDANLIRLCPRFQQPRGYFLHICCLSPAQTSRVITWQEHFVEFLQSKLAQRNKEIWNLLR